MKSDRVAFLDSNGILILAWIVPAISTIKYLAGKSQHPVVLSTAPALRVAYLVGLLAWLLLAVLAFWRGSRLGLFSATGIIGFAAAASLNSSDPFGITAYLAIGAMGIWAAFREYAALQSPG